MVVVFVGYLGSLRNHESHDIDLFQVQVLREISKCGKIVLSTQVLYALKVFASFSL